MTPRFSFYSLANKLHKWLPYWFEPKTEIQLFPWLIPSTHGNTNHFEAQL